MRFLSTVVVLLLAGGSTTTRAFRSVRTVPYTRLSPRRLPPPLHLNPDIAKFIDHELYRQQHKEDYEKEWMQKNRAAILHQLLRTTEAEETSTTSDDMFRDLRQYHKDVKMAQDDPRRYCIDRCLSTGNCDVYQDFFEFTPAQVVQFCQECVVADEEQEECEIPEHFYDLDQTKLNGGLGP